MGLVQRAGDIDLPRLAARFGEQIDTERIVARVSAAFTGRLAAVQERLAMVQRDLDLHEEARSAGDRLRQARARRDEAVRQVKVLQRHMGELHGAVSDIEQEMCGIGTPSGLFAKRKQAKLDALDRMLWQRRDEVILLDRRLALAVTEQHRHAGDVSTLEQYLAVLGQRLRGVAALGDLREEADGLRREATALEQELRKVADVVRSNCQVMGTTVARAVQSRKLLDTIDVVIIDEAGMVNTPSAWCAAGLAARRVVIAGDFRQLPAVTKASGDRRASDGDRQHAARWMDSDPFATAGLVDSTGTARRGDRRMVCLDTQYRMRPAICEIVNTVAYPDSPLRTGRDDLSRLPVSALLESPLVLVDTTPRRLPDPTSRSSSHTTNAVHEAVVHELIRGLQFDDVLPARKWTDLPAGQKPTDRLAVIAPYKAQVKALRESLAYRFGEPYEGLIDTVHRFQGSQRPLVIIDTVAGAGRKLGYFYDHLGLSSSTCRLLNVALSRAQDHLVVVADIEFLRSRLNPVSEAARMLTFLERRARRLSVDDLVPFRSAADLAGLPEEELARPSFFPADEVPRAVAWDIARARRTIEIHCAFLDPVPVRKWLGLLATRIGDGVQVTVHTRDQSDDPRRKDLVREMEAAGCQVSVRERMHEKLLIIDETVLWHGSLNLLANTGPTDLMMRITDPTSCRRVRHIVERARMERPVRVWGGGQPAASSEGAAVAAGSVKDGRLYLYVPYERKDEFKRAMRSAGVEYRWYGAGKLWHIAAETPRHHVRQWLPPGDE
ncbi:AAA family ATPase [Nonomuraea sp. SMC257]|uniref:AAA family ATPase n=1 Tax=Nonomuraea montanisoli TaxID=2741721 RepID=A0A7Y6IG98_9ACTN|nr:AAA domain-containing protein [Nonomuraea montanisoli]NUW37045.1 AAA family ATPase [Nonomuraea montanisoli]